MKARYYEVLLLLLLPQRRKHTLIEYYFKQTSTHLLKTANANTKQKIDTIIPNIRLHCHGTSQKKQVNVSYVTLCRSIIIIFINVL